ncbi:MAG: hypothetical protein QM535_22005 [Limnohabitans sp.]|nr:hypothetical protein [Limnohabitans sp.]
MKLTPFESKQNDENFENIKTDEDFDQKGGNIEVKNFKDRYRQRMLNILKILSKLAIIQGYNEEGNIKNKDGAFMENSDITQLISHVMNNSKILKGEQEFIHLLLEAKVPPSLIVNENVRNKMLSGDFKLTSDVSASIKYKEPEVSKPVDIIDDYQILKKGEKRQVEDEIFVSNKKPKTFEPNIDHPYAKKRSFDEISHKEEYNTNKRTKQDGFGILGWIIPKLKKN